MRCNQPYTNKIVTELRSQNYTVIAPSQESQLQVESHSHTEHANENDKEISRDASMVIEDRPSITSEMGTIEDTHRRESAETNAADTAAETGRARSKAYGKGGKNNMERGPYKKYKRVTTKKAT